MTLAGLTTALSSHLAVVNLRLALLEGSEPEAATEASLDLVKRLLLESGLGEQEAELMLESARTMIDTLLGHIA